MRFAAIAALFAASAAALPALSALQPRDCEILKCAAALDPAGIACITSALQESLDLLTDLPCIAAIINDIANPLDSCTSCLSDLK
jgi:hypothetical protein